MMGCPLPMNVTTMDIILMVGIKIFLIVWVVFVPIVITARLDKIVKLLEDRK